MEAGAASRRVPQQKTFCGWQFLLYPQLLHQISRARCAPRQLASRILGRHCLHIDPAAIDWEKCSSTPPFVPSQWKSPSMSSLSSQLYVELPAAPPTVAALHPRPPGNALLRSALYNWPAKIEHRPADSNGFCTGKTGTVHNTAVFSDIYLSLENRPANAQFWPANCKVHSLESGHGDTMRQLFGRETKQRTEALLSSTEQKVGTEATAVGLGPAGTRPTSRASNNSSRECRTSRSPDGGIR